MILLTPTNKTKQQKELLLTSIHRVAGRYFYNCHIWLRRYFVIIAMFNSQVKEAMQRIHDRGNIGKLILDVEKTPTPLVCQHVVCVLCVR